MTSSDEHRAESRSKSVDSVQARGRAGAHSTRLGEASRLVVVLDHMVAGVAGGDHKTAADGGARCDDQLRWIRDANRMQLKGP